MNIVSTVERWGLNPHCSSGKNVIAFAVVTKATCDGFEECFACVSYEGVPR